MMPLYLCIRMQEAEGCVTSVNLLSLAVNICKISCMRMQFIIASLSLYSSSFSGKRKITYKVQTLCSPSNPIDLRRFQDMNAFQIPSTLLLPKIVLIHKQECRSMRASFLAGCNVAGKPGQRDRTKVVDNRCGRHLMRSSGSIQKTGCT